MSRNYQAATVLLKGLQEVLAPERCIVCLKAGMWLCLSCWHDVAQQYPSTMACVGCGEHATSRGLTCKECRKDTALVGAVSAGSYQLPHLQRGVRWLKFKGIRAVAPALAQLLLPRLLLIAPLDQLRQEAVFIPIPLHPRRQRERGFNQSELLANSLAQDTGIPVAPALARHRSTWAQSHLPTELRAGNIKDSFQIAPDFQFRPLAKRRIAILVDDVTTSGSTLRAAAEALKPVAGWQLWGLTVARG